MIDAPHFALAALALILAIPFLVISTAYHLHTSKELHKMALNFANLQAAIVTLETNVAAVQTEVTTLQTASTDTTDQATLDAITASVTTANSTLAALVPAPAEPTS